MKDQTRLSSLSSVDNAYQENSPIQARFSSTDDVKRQDCLNNYLAVGIQARIFVLPSNFVSRQHNTAREVSHDYENCIDIEPHRVPISQIQ